MPELPVRTKDTVASTIQHLLAEAFPRPPLMVNCAAHSWLARRVCEELLGLQFQIVAGSCLWLDTQDRLIGWNAENGPFAFHYWISRPVGARVEVVDFTSCFWKEIAGQAGSALRMPPPPYLWCFQDQLDPTWNYIEVSGLEAEADRVIEHRLGGLAEKAINLCREILSA